MISSGMDNLPGTKTLKSPPTIKGSMRPFYQHPWPTDLPTQCPVCGNTFRTGWNIEVDHGKIGRFLKNASIYSVVPCVLGAFPVAIGFSSGWVFFGMIFAPALLYLASLLLPIRRRVECRKCPWSKDYPPGKTTPILPAKAPP